MGIESGPKCIPEDDQTSSESRKPEKPTDKTDWSLVERIAREMQKKERSVTVSEDRKETIPMDELEEERAETPPVSNTPTIKPNHLALRPIGAEQSLAQELADDLQTSREQAYRKIKADQDAYRIKLGIHKSPEELAEEDRQLRKKFDLD